MASGPNFAFAGDYLPQHPGLLKPLSAQSGDGSDSKARGKGRGNGKGKGKGRGMPRKKTFANWGNITTLATMVMRVAKKTMRITYNHDSYQ